MVRKTSALVAFACATALGGTAATAMDNERKLVGSMVTLDAEMMTLFEMLDKNDDGSVSAEEIEVHQAMMNKFVMMALDNNRR